MSNASKPHHGVPNSDPEQIEAIYHVDPLCGWCFAIAGELAEARSILGSEVAWTIAMGGLVTGDRVRPVGHDAEYLRSGLAQVARTSGRVATEAYFDRIVDVGTWVSDSETVCRAVLVALRIGGVEAAFVASHFLSDRLYIDGVAPDSPESIAALAKTLGIDAAKFLDDWNSAESRRRLADHWTETRRTGLTTYPTIAVRRGGRLFEVITGFATSSDIIEAVQG